MIKTHECYYPLYEDKEHFIILVTGGRGSGKSYSVGTFIERMMFERYKLDATKKIVHNILYTRYTMTSASISVIPEFLEKVEADGTSQYFHTTKTDVTNTLTGAKVMFRGIKTSSGNQTAKLKSIQGITTFVCDEAEEWTSEKEFETIMFSIRQKGIQNRIIIIMNPTDSNHFIYQKYIKDTHKLVEYDGVPVQISTHPNVLHIHTSYLNNVEHLSEEFMKEAKMMKETNPERYAHIFMGQWADVAEGAVFKKWGIVDEFPKECTKVGLGMDFGFTHDPTAIVRCGIIGNKLYLDEECYETNLLSSDIIKKIRAINERDFTNYKVIADSADPRLIQEVANGGILIYPVMKGAGSIMAGIDKMQTLELYVTKRSVNLQEEWRNYTWDKDKDGNFINQPIDAWNHCFTADTMIMTSEGEKPIIDIKVGDMVLTSNGYRMVTKFFDNGVQKVKDYEISVGNKIIKITATPNHKVKTSNGWKEIDLLTKSDRIYLCKSLTAKSIIFTKVSDISRVVKKGYISLFGNTIMGKYLKGIISTILTKTHITTLSKTLKQFHAANSRLSHVYDIEVEDMHEFFANGVLVHNCTDATRYWVLGELLGQIMMPKRIDTSRLGIF